MADTSKTVNRVNIRPADATDASNSHAALVKLGLFTFLMVVLPISSYYISLENYFGGKNTTGAAIVAAIAANLILVAFIVVAFFDNDEKTRVDERKVQ